MTKVASVSIVALLAAAGAAQAGILNNTLTNVSIFGYGYDIKIYRVATDLSTQGLPFSPGRVEPEGMTWHNGTLYVASDGSNAEARGYLAAYANGDLSSAPTGVRYTATVGANTAAYGPEGITVNTRGSGFGSFSGNQPKFVGIDNVISPVSARVLGEMNSATGVVENGIVNASFNFDDVAYVPGTDAASDRFAFIDGGAAIPELTYYTTASTPTFTGTKFALVAQAKGLLYLPAADAALFVPGWNQDALLVSAGADFAGDFNKLLIYSLDGTLLNKSNLPTGNAASGLFANSATGGIEALAFDSATKRLFIGDEAGSSSQIAVISVPTPGAVGIVGLGLLAAARRRRA